MPRRVRRSTVRHRVRIPIVRRARTLLFARSKDRRQLAYFSLEPIISNIRISVRQINLASVEPLKYTMTTVIEQQTSPETSVRNGASMIRSFLSLRTVVLQSIEERSGGN